MLDRTITPETKLPDSVRLPQTDTRILKNGLKLMSMRAGTQDVLRLTIVFRAGTRYQSTPFVASAMLNMLSEGSQKYSSAEIADRLDFYGIYYDTNIDRDYSMITIGCLNKFLGESLELLEELLLRPIFDAKELATYAAKRKQNIRIEREKPAFIAREEFSRTLFGSDHPYGVASNEKDYDTITSNLLKEHYTKYYTAQNCFAVTSGMVGDEELNQIEELLCKIPLGSSYTSRPMPKAESVLERHVEREGALQSSIRMGKVLFNKTHADYNAMQIISMILGGYFGSRLVKNLREERGYTYGIYAAMVTLEHAGYFAIATDVAAEHRQDAIIQIKAEIEKMRTELVTIEELDMVRNTIVGELMRLVDGPFGIADITIESEQCGRDNEVINEFLAEVKDITPQRILQLAQEHLDPATLTCVTVG